VRADVTPDGQIISGEPVLTLQYNTQAEHERTLNVTGEQIPRYVIKRIAKLGAWGDKCEVYSTSDGGQKVASIDFHSIPPRIEVDFVKDTRKIKIKTSNVRQFDALGGLGRLHWKPTGMVAYGKASWELRSDTKLVLLVTINDNQTNGVISLYKEKVDGKVMEELVVVGIAQIDEYKKLLRVSKISAATVLLG
jgi:hypothetical protein